MKMDSISSKVSLIVDRRLAANEPVELNWVVHEFVQQHNNISGADVEIYRTALYSHVKNIAKRIVKRFDDESEVDQETLLPGHEFLRVAYSMSRDGEQVLVPIEQCSNVELLARADEFVRNASGLKEHARELKLFVGTRRVAAQF